MLLSMVAEFWFQMSSRVVLLDASMNNTAFYHASKLGNIVGVQGTGEM